MTSDRLARDYLARARVRRQTVGVLMTARSYPDVVGAEPPKRHDVHRVLDHFIERFPAEWATALAELREALNRLSQDRGPSFYGDEEHDIPASELFGEADAQRAIAVADRLLDLYARLLGEDQP